MEKNTCGQCGHFRRHYVLDEQLCTAVCCGHCVFPRLKNRRPDTPACGSFVAGEQQGPLSKHFLTMELIRWVQSLEFPPEIREEV